MASYTKKDMIKAGSYFLFQAAIYPIRFLLENYPQSFGAEFKSPRKCLERVKKERLEESLQ